MLVDVKDVKSVVGQTEWGGEKCCEVMHEGEGQH